MDDMRTLSNKMKALQLKVEKVIHQHVLGVLFEQIDKMHYCLVPLLMPSNQVVIIAVSQNLIKFLVCPARNQFSIFVRQW